MKTLLFFLLAISCCAQTTVTYSPALAFSSNNVSTNGTFSVFTNVPTVYYASTVTTNNNGVTQVYQVPTGSNVTSYATATNIATYLPTPYPRYGTAAFATPFTTSTTVTIWPALPGTNFVNSMQWTLTSTTGTISTMPNITISSPTTTSFVLTISADLPVGEQLHYTLTEIQ